jgi:hypothetical protein
MSKMQVESTLRCYCVVTETTVIKVLGICAEEEAGYLELPEHHQWK